MKRILVKEGVSPTMTDGEGTFLPCSREDQTALGKRARLWHTANAIFLEQGALLGRQVLRQVLGLPQV